MVCFSFLVCGYCMVIDCRYLIDLVINVLCFVIQETEDTALAPKTTATGQYEFKAAANPIPAQGFSF